MAPRAYGAAFRIDTSYTEGDREDPSVTARPEGGKIAVKAIDRLGDEAMRVFDV